MIIKMLRMIVLFCGLFALAMGTNIPDGIQVCHKSDPDFRACVGKSMETSLRLLAEGKKELGVPSLKPLFIKEMEIGESKGESLSIKQKYHDVKVHGMPNSKIQMIDIDMNKGCSWKMNVTNPMIRLEGHYELEGQMFVFPINAKGKCTITEHNLNDIHTVTCERYKKNGKNYVRLTKYTMDMKAESIRYNFTDIFPGNQQISEEILKTMNDNDLSIFKEVKPGLQSVFSQLQMQGFNNFLSRFTEDQLFPQ